MMVTAVARITVLGLATLMTFAIVAHAQGQTGSSTPRRESVQPGALNLTRIRVGPLAAVSKPTSAPIAVSTQTQGSSPQCRPGRRAWIGALIGAGAVVPLAKLAHTRFENEAANGAGAATTTVILGAGAGAFLGLASCR
jgi:hypothetical protein